MRSRLRRITIASKVYLWNVQRLDSRYVVLKIWLQDRPRRDFPLEVRIQIDDFWLNFGEILATPAERRDEFFQLEPITIQNVREIIEAAQELGWSNAHPKQPRHFAYSKQGGLLISE
jgi:hypothetical protein